MDDAVFDIFGERGSNGDLELSENAKKVAIPWVEKYRPKTIDDLVIDAKTKQMFKDMIAANNISNMTLYGSAGIGKSTIARMLPRAVNAEVKFIPCGTDGTVDVVRDQIRPFCESASAGRIKCVILDEFDAASGGNAAANGMQKALRSLMEAFTDTRFIITCNYPQKIIEPIFSRCPKIHIGFTLRDVACRLKEIWDKEGIKYDSDTAREFTVRFVKPKMPDIRSIINTAYMMCSSGELVISEDSQNNVVSTALAEFGQTAINDISNGMDYRIVRQNLLSNTTIYNGDYELMVSAMADAVIANGLNPSSIPMMAETAYRMSQVNDPSLQLAALILNLQKVLCKQQ